MQNASKPRSKGFTLVELLVVIAIITVLIAILLPVVMKVRRRALVLVCPVAFVDQSDGALHLTDLRFSNNFAVSPGFVGERIGKPIWSPSGQRIGFTVGTGNSREHPETIYIVNPATNVIYKHAAFDNGGGSLFGGWIDDDRFIEFTHYFTYIRDAKSGEVLRYIQVLRGGDVPGGPYYLTGLGWNKRYASISVAPASSDGDGYDGIVRFVRGDISNGRMIWEPTQTNMGFIRGTPNGEVEVDYTGEWVLFHAWIKGNVNTHVTGIKPLSAGPSTKFIRTMFSPNWMEDGNILAGGLVVYNKEGEWVRDSGRSINASYVTLRRRWNDRP